jgi:taurine dioxygenase
MYAIYDALPARLKDRISGLKIKHDCTYNSGGYVRQGVTATDDPLTSPGAVHPLVCTHPDTTRRMLYLGRRRNASSARSTTMPAPLLYPLFKFSTGLNRA